MDDDVKRWIQDSAAETRQHFDVVAEGLLRQVQLVAEGVSSNGERTERLASRLDRFEDGIHHEFEEVRSMIRLSYTELDRRLRSLEETVGALQSRMDRIESGSTQ
ncbi:MAG TPA: hypothetical protein VHL58_18975 [Thermoanaerobaculia bacterium]|nr:hypothetical protein [Thermoanaerobaculia bacterium]